MPKTEFEMRGKLPTKEPIYVERWEEMKLYDEMQKVRENAPYYVLHDGPPYANGDIHLGHGLNTIIKDFIVRSHFMEGYKTPFIPGWDTHGLPIETQIQKNGHDRKTMSTVDFRELCHNYALDQVAAQMATMKRLGTVADYDHPYLTLNKDFEANQIKVFGKMAMDGLIYQGLKPVYWSPSSETALAEAEIEYKDVKSPTMFIAFKVEDGKGVLDNDTSFIIWTTTPWTIPANLAICLNADMTYAVVQSEKGKFVVLKELVDSLWEKFGWEQKDIVKEFKGRELEMITAKHPFYDRTSLVILGDHVTADAGTGCVHTAPGHGVDDFNVGTKYGIEPYCPVDAQGYMTEEAGPRLAGKFVDDANKEVGQMLEEVDALIKFEWITHSYPHDWRTKKPIIFRATTQWFASVANIRQNILDEIEKVNWSPEWGQKRMYNMIKDRGDWCISRQRIWGVPIPIFYAEDGTPIMSEEIFAHVSELFREYGSNIWYEKDAKELLPSGFTHPNSPNGEFTKEKDTMDVWFDSGSSHTGVLIERGLPYPADVYMEGSDQYRGWFNSSLIIGTAVYGKAPYKQIVSHGFVVDGKGVKMSKSQWNSVSPAAIIKQYGAEILRLWTATIDFQADMAMTEELLKQTSESYRKVRNTFRFLIANINPEDFTKGDLVEMEDLNNLDKYMMIRLHEASEKVRNAYKNFNYIEVANTLINLMTNDFSSYYLDYTKDILYIEAKDSPKRRSVQTVLYHAVDVLMRLWAPILVVTTEELNDYFKTEERSIHLGTFATTTLPENADALSADMKRLFEIREDVYKALEEAREQKVIGKSLEAKISLALSSEDRELVERVLGEGMAQWFIVSKAEFVDEASKQYEVCGVSVTHADGVVCPRCWNITDSTSEDGLCERCASVLNK